MGRLLGLDVGRKRTGMAVTDPLRIIPDGMGYASTGEIPDRVRDYCQREEVDAIIIGLPKQADNTPSESEKYITPLINRLRKLLPTMPIIRYDERFTSVIANRTLLESGMGRMKRREKGLVDEISAVIILRDFLESRTYREMQERGEI